MYVKERLSMDPEEADNAGDSNPPSGQRPAQEDPDNQSGPVLATPELSQFIENMGLQYEVYDVPRIGGRILGLLMVSPNPMTSEEMSETLQVSRSSISTNLRTLLMTGLIEKVSIPGDRLDYYVFAEDAWLRIIEMRLEEVLSLKEAAEEGLESLHSSHPARKRIEEMRSWADMVQTAYQHLSKNWQSQREVPA
jgi:DNA-binding transcriptional regulator GbsR (MarR family)